MAGAFSDEAIKQHGVGAKARRLLFPYDETLNPPVAATPAAGVAPAPATEDALRRASVAVGGVLPADHPSRLFKAGVDAPGVALSADQASQPMIKIGDGYQRNPLVTSGDQVGKLDAIGSGNTASFDGGGGGAGAFTSGRARANSFSPDNPYAEEFTPEMLPDTELRSQRAINIRNEAAAAIAKERGLDLSNYDMSGATWNPFSEIDERELGSKIKDVAAKHRRNLMEQSLAERLGPDPYDVDLVTEHLRPQLIEAGKFNPEPKFGWEVEANQLALNSAREKYAEDYFARRKQAESAGLVNYLEQPQKTGPDSTFLGRADAFLKPDGYSDELRQALTAPKVYTEEEKAAYVDRQLSERDALAQQWENRPQEEKLMAQAGITMLSEPDYRYDEITRSEAEYSPGHLTGKSTYRGMRQFSEIVPTQIGVKQVFVDRMGRRFNSLEEALAGRSYDNAKAEAEIDLNRAQATNQRATAGKSDKMAEADKTKFEFKDRTDPETMKTTTEVFRTQGNRIDRMVDDGQGGYVAAADVEAAKRAKVAQFQQAWASDQEGTKKILLAEYQKLTDSNQRAAFKKKIAALIGDNSFLK